MHLNTKRLSSKNQANQKMENYNGVMDAAAFNGIFEITDSKEHSPSAPGQKQKDSCQKCRLKRKRSFGNNDGKARINSWTAIEEVFLIGVVVMKYLSQGTLFAAKKDEESQQSDSSNILACWSGIMKIFDQAWKKYCSLSSCQRPCRRTPNALARHYKVMKSRLSEPDGELSFHKLYSQWRTLYNSNNRLIDPCDCPELNEDLAEYDSLEDSIDDFMPTSKPLNRKKRLQRINSWTYEEEVFLVGTVMDRFLSRGSLVSPRRRVSKSDRDEDCWTSIKAKYEGAWERHIQLTNGQPQLPRTVNALSRHYKVMRARVSNSNGKESLHVLFDKWFDTYNKDGRLLPVDWAMTEGTTKKRKRSLIKSEKVSVKQEASDKCKQCTDDIQNSMPRYKHSMLKTEPFDKFTHEEKESISVIDFDELQSCLHNHQARPAFGNNEHHVMIYNDEDPMASSWRRDAYPDSVDRGRFRTQQRNWDPEGIGEEVLSNQDYEYLLDDINSLDFWINDDIKEEKQETISERTPTKDVRIAVI